MEVQRVVPILRIFSEEKAKEFYVGFLGFTIDWEHRFTADSPLYMQVSRDGVVLHLSEHYGDGTPGSAIFVEMQGLEALHGELTAKNYRYLRPGIGDVPWNSKMMTVIDPFGNTIRFNQRN